MPDCCKPDDLGFRPTSGNRQVKPICIAVEGRGRIVELRCEHGIQCYVLTAEPVLWQRWITEN
jgi:hypothetical protein